MCGHSKIGKADEVSGIKVCLPQESASRGLCTRLKPVQPSRGTKMKSGGGVRISSLKNIELFGLLS